MKGILFDDFVVHLDDRTPEVGGSFLWSMVSEDGVANAYDQDLIKFVHSRLATMKDAIMVDVGAGTGSFTLLARLPNVKHVYAFEPNPCSCELLMSNIILNGLSNKVAVYNIVLAQNMATITLKIPVDRTQHGFVTVCEPTKFHDYNVMHTIAHSMDTVVETNVDFIKTDANGYDYHVLQGAKSILVRYHPEIVFEHSTVAERSYHIDAVKIFLFGLGYTRFEKVGREDWWVSQF